MLGTSPFSGLTANHIQAKAITPTVNAIAIYRSFRFFLFSAPAAFAVALFVPSSSADFTAHIDYHQQLRCIANPATHHRSLPVRAAFPWKASTVRSPSGKQPAGKRPVWPQHPPASAPQPFAPKSAAIALVLVAFRIFCKPNRKAIYIIPL